MYFVFWCCKALRWNGNPGESAEAFVLRQFEDELQKEIIELHPIIEYAWGDTEKGKKILCFIPAKYGASGMMQAKVFLPQGKNTYQIALIDKILFTGGGESEQVSTVFFDDIDGTGDKELLFIKKASVKDYKDPAGWKGVEKCTLSPSSI